MEQCVKSKLTNTESVCKGPKMRVNGGGGGFIPGLDVSWIAAPYLGRGLLLPNALKGLTAEVIETDATSLCLSDLVQK